MTRFACLLAIGTLGGVALFATELPASAAPSPKVTSIIEGRDSSTGRVTLLVVGNGVSKFRTFSLRDTTGAETVGVEVAAKSSTMVALRLSGAAVATTYTLVMTSGRHVEQSFVVTLAPNGIGSGTVTRETLAPSLLSDLEDASTFGGLQPAQYALISQIPSTNGAGFTGLVTVAVTSGDGIASATTAPIGRGVLGWAQSTTGASIGVQGIADSTAGVGLFGQATGGSGNTIGTYGRAASATGRGVFGEATSGSGSTIGVEGSVNSPDGIGCYGIMLASTGTGSGVTGITASVAGTGVYGFASNTSGSGAGVAGRTSGASGSGVFGSTGNAGGSACGVLGLADGSSGIGVSGQATSSTGSTVGVKATADSSSGWGLYAIANGSGTSSAAVVADHAGTSGNIAIFRSGGANKARIDKSGTGYFDGGTQTSGADFAESVEVDRPKAEFEPGDVLVIDAQGERRFAMSKDAESPLVAGIYATRPGVLARKGGVAGPEDWAATEVPMAITGIVPCKVCDEGGPVRAGDLLVTASIAGYARKAPAAPKPGTLLGKALGRLEGARGKVEVLLTMR